MAGPRAGRVAGGLLLGWMGVMGLPDSATGAAPPPGPELTATYSYPAMTALLERLNRPGFIQVEAVGGSTSGRRLWLLHLHHGRRSAEGKTRLFLYAQQHGDEVAGKDALLLLAQAIAAEPERLPDDVDLWLMPMVNPDGAEAGTRVNGAGADLNRDHQRLGQPETRAFYAAVQRIMPHLAVDFHEFGRAGGGWRSRGWRKWPDLTMDTAVHPFFDPRLARAGLAWIDAAAPALRRDGIRFARYTVGGPPPENEIRPSTLEFDDARSGVASYGALSFIVECARLDGSGVATPLQFRVNAGLALIGRLLADRGFRDTVRPLVEEGWGSPPRPDHLPVNCFWGNAGLRVEGVPVLAIDGDREIVVPSAQVMHDVVVKKCVERPAAYVIDGRFRSLFEPLLRAHGLRYEVLDRPRPAEVETYRLLRIEREYDDVYERYEGRQIVAPVGRQLEELAAGSLLLSVGQPGARRLFMHLEPAQLYGLTIFPEFAAAVIDGRLPVRRVLGWPGLTGERASGI